jgi:hypothetical protein
VSTDARHAEPFTCPCGHLLPRASVSLGKFGDELPRDIFRAIASNIQVAMLCPKCGRAHRYDTLPASVTMPDKDRPFAEGRRGS